MMVLVGGEGLDNFRIGDVLDFGYPIPDVGVFITHKLFEYV